MLFTALDDGVSAQLMIILADGAHPVHGRCYACACACACVVRGCTDARHRVNAKYINFPHNMDA